MIDEKFLLNDWIQKIKTTLGKDAWIPLYYSEHDDKRHIVLFSGLVPETMIKNILERKDYSWDLHIGDGRPGFNFRFEDGKPIPEYCKYGTPSEIQPILIVRNYYGIREDNKEISEEFRLYFNLYHDVPNKKYVMIKDDGNEEDVIRFEKNQILIRSKYIKEFIAAKKLKFAIYFDMYSYSEKTLEEQKLKPIDEYYSDDNIIYHYHVSNFDMGASENHNAISSIIGKKYISGLSEFEPEYLPNTDKEDYEEFIIGINEDGKEISFSCNPEKLANYFGANPKNPHYLTPVFFERKVLARYYDEPSKYSIKDGYLSCGALWGMRIDNNHDKYVIVYLGDLGRDLPESHRKYWRGFNITPDGGISEVQFRRGFLAEFTDPSSPDLVFKQKLSQLKKAWVEKYKWSLFKDLNEKDKFHLTALRIPTKDEQPEFDSQIQSLTKILIDSISESKIKNYITIDEDDKSITKLEKFFTSENFKDYQKYISFLRSIQDLRSKGSAHRKGQDYEKKYSEIISRMNISSDKLSYVFRDILNLAIDFIDYLINSIKVENKK